MADGPPPACYRRYILPKGNAEFHRRVAAAMGLLVGAKLLNVQVPFLFKYTGGRGKGAACRGRAAYSSKLHYQLCQ